MFYLLEDNIIVDSENLPYEWKFYTVLISEKDKTIILHCPDPRERKGYKIKKQSENVFDLIEKGVLIKYLEIYNTNQIRFEIVTGFCESLDGVRTGSLITQYNTMIYFEKVLAIYNLDAKGNYIKVYEVKTNVY